MRANSSRLVCWLTVFAAMIVVVWSQSQAMAQRRNQSYFIQHAFSWQPTIPSATFTVDWYHFEHAAAWDETTSQVSVTVPQNVGFNGLLGRDWLTTQGVAWNSGMGSPVQIIEANSYLTGVTPPAGGSSTQSAILTNASATATSSWSISAMSQNGVSATNTTSGSSSTSGSHSNIAYAYSESRLSITDQPAGIPAGRVDWTPRWYDAIGSGSAMAWDPMHVTLYNELGGIVLEDTPIHIEGVLGKGELDDSLLGWEDGHLFAAGVIEGLITGEVNSPFIDPSQHFDFEIKIENGIVTTSQATGIAASYVLPAVGSPGTFDVPFLTTVSVDYLYPATGGVMELSLGGGGSGGSVPEPGILILLITGGLGLLVSVARSRKS